MLALSARPILHGSARQDPSVTNADGNFCAFIEEGEEEENRTPRGGRSSERRRWQAFVALMQMKAATFQYA